MANTITDNRTTLFQANALTGDNGGSWSSLSSTSPALDTDVTIEGTGSVAEQATNSRRDLIWDAGSTADFSNTVVYMWVNCGVVGLLDTKTNGGLRMKFTGASATNFFEVNIAGSDDYPQAVAGGWVQFVVDVPLAQASPDATGGTPPALTAIQGVGISFLTSAMTKVADNIWVDAAWTLADGTAGILVQGRNGGTTPWDWGDILTQLGSSSGALKAGPAGTYILNTSVQFGISDTTTHEFLDTNAVVLFDSQDWMNTDHYFIRGLGNTGGTTNITFGVKTGSGTTATGAQGCTFIGDPVDPNRCSWDFDDPDLDLVGLYGCTFQHQGDFQLDDPAVETISCQFIDCNGATVSNSLFLRNKIIDSNTADGVAFAVTDDFGDIVYCQFEWSDGHAVELNATTPTSQNNVGNLFSGFTNTVNSTDAAVLNSAAGSLTINSSGGSNLQSNSYRNTGGGSVTINNNISITFSGLKDNTEVRIYSAGTSTELDGIENATAGTADNRTFTASIAASTSVDYVIHNVAYENIRTQSFSWPTSDSTLPVQQRLDRNYILNT